MKAAQPYTSDWQGIRHFFTDSFTKYRLQSDVVSHVNRILADTKYVEKCIRDAYGAEIRGCDMLEIGPGQIPLQMLYFSQYNRVVGIDTSLVSRSRTPFALWRIARMDGPMRAVKTMARWLLGLDRQYEREFARQFGIQQLDGDPTILCMDAQQMDFPDESFDLVYSRAVFQHLAKAPRGIAEVRRVMRPGAVAYIALHLYSSHDGYSYIPGDPNTAEWPHLRGLLAAGSEEKARNRMRLQEWKQTFSNIMPDCRFILRGPDNPVFRERAIRLQHSRDLAGYTLEELLTSEVAAIWRKPESVSAS